MIKLAVYLFFAVLMMFVTHWAFARAIDRPSAYTISMFLIDVWGIAFWTAVTFQSAVRLFWQVGKDEAKGGKR